MVFVHHSLSMIATRHIIMTKKSSSQFQIGYIFNQYFLTCSTIKRCKYSFRNSCPLKTRMVQSPFPIVKPLSTFVSNSRCVDLGPPKWHTKRHTRLHRSFPSSQHW